MAWNVNTIRPCSLELSEANDFIGETRPKGRKSGQRRPKPKANRQTGARQEPAGSRLGAALTGQLIVLFRWPSKLDANAPRRENRSFGPLHIWAVYSNGACKDKIFQMLLVSPSKRPFIATFVGGRQRNMSGSLNVPKSLKSMFVSTWIRDSSSFEC
jgi:hypothetical protein